MNNKVLSNIIRKAELISKAAEEEAEEILEDAEMAVKAVCKASDQPKILRRIEKALEDEGVEALFQKKVSKTAMKKTANVEPMEESEVKELVKNVVDAVVEEFEEMLEDVDEVCDEELKKVFEDEEEVQEEEKAALEARLKKSLERKLANMGIYSKLERKYKVTKKVAKKNSKQEKTVNILKQYRKNRNR